MKVKWTHHRQGVFTEVNGLCVSITREPGHGYCWLIEQEGVAPTLEDAKEQALTLIKGLENDDVQ